MASLHLLILSLLLLSTVVPPSHGAEPTGKPPNTLPEECQNSSGGPCHSKARSLKLKLIAIAAILVTSMAGVTLPILSRVVPALQPDKKLFVLVKAFASGVILATGYMHVLPDSFDCLTSKCLPENPWRKFPFTTFIAMLSAVATLMVDSYAMSWYKKYGSSVQGNKNLNPQVLKISGHCHGEGSSGLDDPVSQLRRYRVVAQVLELGIVVHSVVIGLSMGASDNLCTIRPLVAALCFHQFFEGMGLGGCILQAEYETKMKAIMVFFFSATTPFGIALGIGLSNVYRENSPTALIVVGVLDAVSAGLLNYMALVDLLASDFMGKKLQDDMKLQAISYAAVFLGAGGMSVMAIWA
ncbi:fe(2+) transport protein 1-like [Cynara cardunculus var. scolymus]|uniref:fe(2+) transport protein 1-like n=1 Tax=Cynara cardunculus var. scolymus TaxID=59895 RepID=UPI000D62F9B1|nr:fe(2+) transport protein 1-like [Cynara cardunculus var. scolymus]